MLFVILMKRLLPITLGLCVTTTLYAETNARVKPEHKAFNRAIQAAQGQQKGARTLTLDAFKKAKQLMHTQKFKDTIKVMQQKIRTVKYQHNIGHAFKDVQPRRLQQMDISALMKKAEALRRNGQKLQPKLYVFVSYSMPDASIKNLYLDANHIEAPLLVRGLVNNNFKDTGRRIISILGRKDRRKKKTSILVSPVLFEKFGITRVPAFVFIKGVPKTLTCRSKKQCRYTAPEHDVVYGDITLRKAVEEISRFNTDERLLVYAKLLEARQ